MKKANSNITELVFILDRSGSMGGLESDTIGGFNSLIKKQKKQDGKCYVSTVLFDNYSEVIHDRVELENIKPMTDKEYYVRGCTALIDAIGGAIHHIANIRKYARSEDVPEHTMFVIMTDGQENASHIYTSDKVKAMIEHEKEKYGWEFLFIGANIDAVKTASHFGISKDRAVNYHADSQGTSVVYDTVVRSIVNPEQPVFSVAVVIVLVLSIAVKSYMYFYNKRFAQITDSETLKATAADCISDSVATFAVLLSTVISYLTDWQIDGYCGVLVSIFIIITGVKSLWEVLGRIMGRTANQKVADSILQNIETYPEIRDVHNFMIHDYGFGYFVVSMRVEGYRKDSEKLYVAINEISYDLYQRFHCDCFIQVDYLIDNEVLKKQLTEKISLILKEYGEQIEIDHFRLIESGQYTNIVFDLLYPVELQKSEEEICENIEHALSLENPQYHTIIKGILRRERYRPHR